MAMADEKRRFTRIFFNVRASLEINREIYKFDRIVNLSVGGCLLEMPKEDPSLRVGQDCVFKILLDHMAPAVEVAGEIVRFRDGEVSIKFTVIDPDNLYHLQNIIRYNAEDPDKIEKELQEHPGLK